MLSTPQGDAQKEPQRHRRRIDRRHAGAGALQMQQKIARVVGVEVGGAFARMRGAIANDANVLALRRWDETAQRHVIDQALA
jgi:hypothetical protein